MRLNEQAMFDAVLNRLPDARLEQEVRRTEAAIIAGTAIEEDYDYYVACQLILARRSLMHPSDVEFDPRD